MPGQGFWMPLGPHNTQVRMHRAADGTLGYALFDVCMGCGALYEEVTAMLSNIRTRYGGGVGPPFSDQVWLQRHNSGKGGRNPSLCMATASVALRIFTRYWKNPQEKTKERLPEMKALLEQLEELAGEVSDLEYWVRRS